MYLGGGGAKMSELPDWTLPYISENYTGPWLSDGKIQESVANGKSKPRSKLDALSRAHDTAYAVHKDRKNRHQADVVYQLGANEIGGFVPRVAGFAVRYLNQFGDGRTLRDTSGNLRGAVKGGGGENMDKYDVSPNLRSESEARTRDEFLFGVPSAQQQKEWRHQQAVKERDRQSQMDQEGGSGHLRGSQPTYNPYVDPKGSREGSTQQVCSDQGGSNSYLPHTEYHFNFRRRARRRRRKWM